MLCWVVSSGGVKMCSRAVGPDPVFVFQDNRTHASKNGVSPRSPSQRQRENTLSAATPKEQVRFYTTISPDSRTSQSLGLVALELLSEPRFLFKNPGCWMRLFNSATDL